MHVLEQYELKVSLVFIVKLSAGGSTIFSR